MEVTVKFLSSLTDQEQSQVERLVLPSGHMSQVLCSRPRGARIAISRARGVITGWGMRDDKHVRLLNGDRIPAVMVFVHPRWRRKGLASKIVRHLISLPPAHELVAYPHTIAGWRLFRSLGFKVKDGGAVLGGQPLKGERQ